MPTLRERFTDDLVDASVDLVVRYALPHSMRLRLFVREVSRLRDALGPAAFLREQGLAAYTMQMDILHEYYRI